jgi:hypothetical protein
MSRPQSALVGVALFCAATSLGYLSSVKFAQAAPAGLCSNTCGCGLVDTFFSGGSGTYNGWRTALGALDQNAVSTNDGVLYTNGACGNGNCVVFNRMPTNLWSYTGADSTCTPNGPFYNACIQECTNGVGGVNQIPANKSTCGACP